MVTVILREEKVSDGDEIELPSGILALTIQPRLSRQMMTVVTWLEEVTA